MAIAEHKEKHKAMIGNMVNILSNAGFEDVRAEIPVCNKTPKRIVLQGTDIGYTPDITALKKEQLHLFDIETEETLPYIRNSKKIHVLSSFSGRVNATYSLVVPTGCEEKATHLLNDLDIFAGVIEIDLGCT